MRYYPLLILKYFAMRTLNQLLSRISFREERQKLLQEKGLSTIVLNFEHEITQQLKQEHAARAARIERLYGVEVASS